MVLLTKSDTFLVGEKQFEVAEVLGNLIYLSSNSVLEFFQSVGLTLPRKLRMGAMKRALDPYVKAKHVALSTLSDEVNYRLGWYEYFTESQLINLVPLFQSEDLIRESREELWLLLLSYMFSKKVSEEDTLRLFGRKKELLIEEVISFNDTLNPLFFDEPNQIDGLEPDTFRSVLFKSSTLVEIREIGKKYGVDVPRRLKKQELASIIKDSLKERNLYTDEEGELIDKMAVIALQRYAKDRDIKASIELKKEEIIEYILANAKETKETYFIPTHPGVYDLIKPEGLEDPVIAEVNETAVEEPVIDHVNEEIIDEEPIVLEFPKEDVVLEEAMNEEEFEALIAEIKALSHEIKILSDEVLELKNHEFTVVNEGKEDDDADDHECGPNCNHHHHNENSVSFEGPKVVFPYQVKVSEKEYITLKKKEQKAMVKRAKELRQNKPIPVKFLDEDI